jgi:hypothetical protein
MVSGRLLALLVLLIELGIANAAAAHPLSQGSLDITIYPGRLTVIARVTTEEVKVVNSSTGENPLPGPWAATGTSSFDQHAEYLAAHLHFIADEKPLIGKVIKVMPPTDDSATQNAFATEELEYALPAGVPRVIELRQDVLADGHFAPGAAWDSMYVVRIGEAGKPALEGLPLTRTQPINFVPGSSSSHINKGQLFRDYFKEGIHHILTGYDHVLFISALVLASRSLWDLVKVVSAFTLSHTITLTLASLGLVAVSTRISEPLISASIVFVALQNVIWPKQSRGWPRLAAAFFFGLFHGLGFAGGFIDAMHAMHGQNVLLAILAFSVGVETGHQLVVIPLFTALKIARNVPSSEVARVKFFFAVQRLGSAAISLAGLYFLVFALKASIRGSS